jgi:adenine-specific DNA-methyltransferase
MPTLDWLNRADAFTTAAKVPYRLLEPISIHGNPQAQDNLLIQGDNLEALKALLPFYRGQVKCIFIDPPYNTKSAFEHYDDNLEHAQWLSMMLPRLQLLRELLREDGSIWVTIDDNEGHYLKVMMDEVFGRGNFVANALWQKVYSERMDAVGFSNDHDHLLCYSKSRNFVVGRLAKSQNSAQFKFIDEVSGLPYRRRSLRKEGSESLRTDRPSMWYPIYTPDGTTVFPVKPDGTEGRWRWMQETYQKDKAQTEFVKVKGAWEIYVKQFLNEESDRPPSTFWLNEEVGHNHEAKLEAQNFDKQSTFSTPKPERLLQRVLQIATNEGDLILDSFLGSGTTAAVAHKMGRRWIGIEMGEHAATHCLPRLQKVIAGEQGGISKAVGWGPANAGDAAKTSTDSAASSSENNGAWTGGGGFRFMRLGEPVFDAQGRIHSAVRFATLAAFVWQQETGTAFAAEQARAGTPYLGIHYIYDSSLCYIPLGLEPISPSNLATAAPVDLFSQPVASTHGAAPTGITPASTAPSSSAETVALHATTPFPQAEPRATAYYLLFNGILKDKRPASGNVLTQAVLDALLLLHASTPRPDAPLVVYGEACRLGEERLKRANVTFKHIPYDVKAR